MRWQVGLTTVPAAAATVSFETSSPSWRDELLGVTGPHKKSGHAPPALAPKRIPTARLPEHGLREIRTTNPPMRPRHVAGERLATDKRQSGYTVLQSAPSMPLPSDRGGGGRGKRSIAFLLFFFFFFFFFKCRDVILDQ